MKKVPFPDDGCNCRGTETGLHAALASPESSDPQGSLPLEPSAKEAERLAMQTALENRKKTAAEKPDCAQAWHQYGEALLSLNRPEEAVLALRKAVGLSPDTLLFHHDLGLALADLNQIQAAKAEFASIVATDPQLKCAGSSLLLAAITNLALSQEKLGERDEAVETLLPALDTALGILFNLGFLHFRARRFDAALPYAHAAYVLKPHNEDVVHQYGAILSELKRFVWMRKPCKTWKSVWFQDLNGVWSQTFSPRMPRRGSRFSGERSDCWGFMCPKKSSSSWPDGFTPA